MLKKYLWLLFVALAIQACKEQAPEKDQSKLIEVRQNFNVIEFEDRGHLYIKGLFQGHSTTVVFDSGADFLFVDSLFYHQGKFDFTNVIDGQIPGVGTQMQKIQIIDEPTQFDFFGHQYICKKTPIISLKTIVGDYADGVLGTEYFRDSILNIDFEKSEFRFLDSLNQIDLAVYAELPFRFQKNRIYIPLEVGFDGKSIRDSFILDMGNGGNLIFTSTFAKKHQLSKLAIPKMGYYTKYGGIGGESQSDFFHLDYLKIDSFYIENYLVQYSQDNRGALSHNHAGLFGNDILRKFNLIIDFINRTLYLRPNLYFSDPIEKPRLSFSYVDRSLTLKAWVVTGLIRNGFAQKIGLAIDDHITHINDLSVDHYSYTDQKELKKLDQWDLRLIRKGNKLELSIELMDLL